MLTPAEQLGLAGAALDARVRQAVNFIPDSTLVHVARRLAEDARASDVVYVHDGTVETVRIMLRPLLVMPEQLGYLHHVCTRIMSALARFPELYARDADVRSVAAARRRRARLVRRGVAATSRTRRQPLYGRLDAVCDFTSARWQDSLQFMEPNLSGVGGIHLGPLAETLVMRDVVPTLLELRPAAAPSTRRAISATCSCKCCSTMRARSAAAAATSCSSSRSTSPKGPTSSRTSSSTTARGAASSSSHADPRELRLVGDDVYYEDMRIDVAYRDYEIRDLLALEHEHGQRARRRSARCSCRTAWSRRSAATSITRAAGKC